MGFYIPDRPLTESEKQWLLSLEAQHAEGKELAPEDADALAEYWQLLNRTPDLERFRMNCEATYFGEWRDETELERTKALNYPAKVKCYKQKRQHRITAQSIRQLIEDERKEQPELKEQAKRSANLQSDRDKMQIKFDLIERVYDDYERFLVKELEELKQAQISELTLRQTAIFYYYTQQPMTENNVANLAAMKGHKSKTSGKQLLEKYAAWCELQESELSTSTRELGALQRDLKQVLPYLTGRAAVAAGAYLTRVTEKKERGL
jgi:hypothetical protein